VVNSDPKENGLRVSRSLTLDQNISVNNYEVKLSESFMHYTNEAKMGNILQQTKGHVQYRSQIELALVVLCAITNKRDLSPLALKNTVAYSRYQDALENRADQVPAACGINSRNATLIEAWLNDASKYKKIDQSRLDTAKRIRRFKQLEETLNK
jgi:hypothetical protein